MIKILTAFSVIGVVVAIVMDLFTIVNTNVNISTTSTVIIDIVKETVNQDYINNFDYNYDYLCDISSINNKNYIYLYKHLNENNIYLELKSNENLSSDSNIIENITSSRVINNSIDSDNSGVIQDKIIENPQKEIITYEKLSQDESIEKFVDTNQKIRYNPNNDQYNYLTIWQFSDDDSYADKTRNIDFLVNLNKEKEKTLINSELNEIINNSQVISDNIFVNITDKEINELNNTNENLDLFYKKLDEESFANDQVFKTNSNKNITIDTINNNITDDIIKNSSLINQSATFKFKNNIIYQSENQINIPKITDKVDHNLLKIKQEHFDITENVNDLKYKILNHKHTDLCKVINVMNENQWDNINLADYFNNTCLKTYNIKNNNLLLEAANNTSNSDDRNILLKYYNNKDILSLDFDNKKQIQEEKLKVSNRMAKLEQKLLLD